MLTMSKGRLSALVAAIPLTILLVFTFQYYFRLVVSDHSHMLGFIEMYYQGELQLGDLLESYGGHFLFFPQTLMLILVVWSGFDIFYQVLASLIFAVFAFIFFLLLVRKIINDFGSTNLGYFIVPVAALFFFSLDQSLNYLWGWQVAVFMSLCSVLAGFYILSTRKMTASVFSMTALLAFVAVYSFATGLAFLPIVFLFICYDVQLTKRQKTGYCICWFVVISLISYDYYNRAVLDHFSNRFEGVFHMLPHLILYAFSYLGSCLVKFVDYMYPINYTPALIGVLGVMIFIYCIKKLITSVKRVTILPLVAIAAYVVGAAIVTAFGRAEPSIVQNLYIQYISFSNMFWLVNIILLMSVFYKFGTKYAPYLICVILLLKLTNSFFVSQRVLTVYDHSQSVAQEIVTQYPNVNPQTLSSVGLDNHLVKVMYERKMNVFKAY